MLQLKYDQKWKFGIMNIWKMELRKYRNLKKCKFGKKKIWKNGNLKKWKFGKMEIWKNGNLEKLKFE